MPCLRALRSLLLCPALLLAQQSTAPPNRGVTPRSAAHEYPAQVTDGAITYAAAVVPQAQAKHLFAFEISKRYVAFEVAFLSRRGSHCRGLA
jgi:hypothetical protein